MEGITMATPEYNAPGLLTRETMCTSRPLPLITGCFMAPILPSLGTCISRGSRDLTPWSFCYMGAAGRRNMGWLP